MFLCEHHCNIESVSLVDKHWICFYHYYLPWYFSIFIFIDCIVWCYREKKEYRTESCWQSLEWIPLTVIFNVANCKHILKKIDDIVLFSFMDREYPWAFDKHFKSKLNCNWEIFFWMPERLIIKELKRND